MKTLQEISEELWDEVSYFVDGDISSLDYVANTNVCREADFIQALKRCAQRYTDQFNPNWIPVAPRTKEISIAIFYILWNHECWWKCKACGLVYDARLSSICGTCQFDNK